MAQITLIEIIWNQSNTIQKLINFNVSHGNYAVVMGFNVSPLFGFTFLVPISCQLQKNVFYKLNFLFQIFIRNWKPTSAVDCCSSWQLDSIVTTNTELILNHWSQGKYSPIVLQASGHFLPTNQYISLFQVSLCFVDVLTLKSCSTAL